ncbi:unnamed protein product [marine sediment metagenome]|uniref:Core-binding (CB) domain-containing protein n=1 Tax=marine sediment metagenome TaxID=412755 RepID=X1D3Y6_9ZZZZ
MSVNISEATFKRVLYELENFRRFANSRISESYAYHLGRLVDELKELQSSSRSPTE